jgi:hypothetical protein
VKVDVGVVGFEATFEDFTSFEDIHTPALTAKDIDDGLKLTGRRHKRSGERVKRRDTVQGALITQTASNSTTDP